jgi:hypothetical protein
MRRLIPENRTTNTVHGAIITGTRTLPIQTGVHLPGLRPTIMIIPGVLLGDGMAVIVLIGE